MNPIEIRGPENSVSHRSKIMERKKHGGYGSEGRGRSYTRAKHGKAISVQPRFLVSAKGVFVRKPGNLHARLHICAPPVKKNELSWMVERFAIPSVSLRLSLPLPYYELRHASDSLSTVSMKPDEYVLSISPSLMIINARHDEISLMEHNIPAVLSRYYYLISRTKDTFRRALVQPHWVREIFIIAHKCLLCLLLTREINFTRRHIFVTANRAIHFHFDRENRYYRAVICKWPYKNQFNEKMPQIAPIYIYRIE